MRDLAFDIRARDTTQAAFAAAGRNAREFGRDLDRNGRAAFDAAAGAADRFAAATDRAAAAGRRLSSANDNWRRRNLMMQGFDVGQMLALGQNPMTTLLQQGPQIAQMYAGQGGVKAALSDTLGMAKSLVGGMGSVGAAFTAAAAVGSIAMLGMQAEINATSDVTVSFADVARASFQVIAGGIYEFVKPAVDAIAPWFASAWETVVSGFKTANNFLIAGWVTVVDAIKTGAMAIPDALIAAGEAGANGFLGAIEQMGREALVAINDLLTDINGMLPDSLKLPLAPAPMSFKVGRADIGGADAMARLSESMSGFRARAEDAFSTDYLGEYYEAVKQAAIENALLGQEADKADGAMKKAANDNIDPWKGLRDTVKETRDETQSFTRDLVQGFAQDVRGALQDGKITLEEWGNIASNVFNKITDKLLNEVLDALFQVNKSGGSLFSGMGGGGGGGLLGGLFGLIGNLFGFANEGSILPGGSGTTDGQVVAFRKSPSERVDVYQPGQGGGGAVYAPVYNIDARGADQAAIERLERGLAERDKKFGKMVDARIAAGQTRRTRA